MQISRRMFKTSMRNIIIFFAVSLAIAVFMYKPFVVYGRIGFVRGSVEILEFLLKGFIFYPWYACFGIHLLTCLYFGTNIKRSESDLESQKILKQFAGTLVLTSLIVVMIHISLKFVGIPDPMGLFDIVLIYGGIPLVIYVMMIVVYAINVYVRSRTLIIEDLSKHQES